jgi:hypothetical protein
MHTRPHRDARRHRRHRPLAAAVLLACVTIAPSAGDTPPPGVEAVHALLRTEGQFTESELAALERDQPVARVLRDVDKRELAAFGAVRVHATSAFLLDRIRDIVGFKRNPMVLQIGRFGSPATIEDLAGLTLERDDIEALRRCRPGDCGVRLPAADIDRIRTAVNWNAPDAPDRATRAMREFLVRQVQAYTAGGTSMLGAYHDKKQPIRVDEEFDRLLAAPLLLRAVPALRDYALHFPAREPAATDEFLYWSKERFGFKPVISVTHVMIHRPPDPSLIDAYVISKQIYASHYFDASLAVTAVVDAPGADRRPAFYMMYLLRNRTPMLEGFFAALMKGPVRSRTRDGLVETLRVTRERLERDFRARNPNPGNRE